MGTLTAEAAKGATTLKVSAAAPAVLQAGGQFTVIVDKEIFLVTAGAATETWTVVPEQESSTGAAHLVGAQVYHFLTKGALERYVQGLIGPWKKLVALATATVLPAHSATATTITGTEKIVLNVDGTAVAVGQRILIPWVAEKAECGLYEVVKKGAAGTEVWELKRTADGSTTAELQDATVTVEKGTVNKGLTFCQVATVTTVGTTVQQWLSDGVTPWTNAEGFTAKSELHETVQVRMESNGAVARLKGSLKAKEEIPASTTLFTIPAGFRPPVEVMCTFQNAGANTVLNLQVTAAGVVSCRSAIAAGNFVGFDSITWNLT